MKLLCLSDLHGHLPDQLPIADVIVLAGDYMPDQEYQEEWTLSTFEPWLQELSSHARIVGIAGNHDRLFQKAPDLASSLSWAYLEDSGCTLGEVRFWGTPWTSQIFPMAFAADEEELEATWKRIPTGIDVLISHGPPYGAGDRSEQGQHCGSRLLASRIDQLKPQMVVCGHIHSGYGVHALKATKVINAALVNDSWKPVNAPLLLELNPRKRDSAVRQTAIAHIAHYPGAN